MLVLGVAATAACGSDDASKSEVRTEVRTVTVEASAPAATSVERAVMAEPTSPAVPPAPAPAAPAPQVQAQALMPPVVCMNLQSAQNAIQAAGVFYSRSADASGQGRMQINDSNWLVVQQEPPAGAVIGEGDALLSVVKIGEPNNC